MCPEACVRLAPGLHRTAPSAAQGGHVMGLLSDRELASLLPAETHAFAGPVPTQSVSSDEFMPVPQTTAQRRVEARVKELGATLARRHGMTYTYERRAALATDRIAALKAEYEAAGAERSNLRYGYVLPARGTDARRRRGGRREAHRDVRYAGRRARRRFSAHAPESTKRGNVIHCSTTKRLTKSAAPLKGIGVSGSRRWPRPWSTSAMTIAMTATIAAISDRPSSAPTSRSVATSSSSSSRIHSRHCSRFMVRGGV